MGSLNMVCTTTAFEKVKDGYRFVSAAHCVGEDNDHKSADPTMDTWYITFDDPTNKTFYEAKPVAVGYQTHGDDFSVFEVTTKDEIPVVGIGDEHSEVAGNAIVNVAAPVGLGKQTFFGKITLPVLERPLIEEGLNWKGSILMDISANGGSSGSAIVSAKQGKIIGFLVGIVGGFKVAIPASKFTAFYGQVKAGTYHWYKPDVE